MYRPLLYFWLVFMCILASTPRFYCPETVGAKDHLSSLFQRIHCATYGTLHYRLFYFSTISIHTLNRYPVRC